MSESTPRADGPTPEAGPPSSGHHLSTLSHGGRFWDVYVEFDDDPDRTDSFAACLLFSPADAEEGEAPHRTTTILIEPSYEEVLYRARAFEDHQLIALLRSCMPG